ncbi:MAG: response regulator transcription factor [Eubacteriales bacterium]|nr:response regulator transcription factor [Eubacteriales bacterium]
MKILYAEDQKDLRDLLTKRLRKDYSVDTCENGEEALDYLTVYTYDLVILDILMPKMDGISLLKWMRQRGIATPVILLTAKSGVEDRVNGLDCGADDYLVKPFSYEELLARIRVHTRRKSSHLTSRLEVGDLVMDTASHTVTRAGTPIHLTSKEYRILEYMMYHPNLLLTRAQLEERVWDSSFEGGSNIVDVYIRYLRKKIDDGFDVKMIRTVRGMGYRLEGEKPRPHSPKTGGEHADSFH